MEKDTAQIVGVMGADLNKADLSMADLCDAELLEAKLFDANLSGANLVGADLGFAQLGGADLHKADLRKSNLCDSNLFEAKLSNANLSGVDLGGADLSMADLSGANLSNAILTDTRFYGASLIVANFSGSDISGADLNNANLSQWIIHGIKCSHISWQGKQLKYNNGEFEKAFTNIEKTIEMILDMPFSDLSHYTGGVIEQAINEKYGERTIMFRGQIALSNHTTKYEFINFGTDEEFKELQGRLIEIQNQLKPVIEETKEKREPKSIIDIKDEIDIPFAKGLVVRPKEVGRLLNERYVQMHPLLQKIVMTVQSAIQ